MSVSKILLKVFFWKSIQFLLSIATYILLANIFKSAVSAEFQTFIYLFSLLTGLFTLGLDVGLNFFLSKKALSAERARAIIVAIMFLALLVGMPGIYFFYHPQFNVRFSAAELMWFGGLYISGSVLVVLSNAIFTAHSKNHIITKIAVLFNAILLFLIFGISRQFGEEKLRAVFYVCFLMTFAQGVAAFLYSFRFNSSSSADLNFSNSASLKKLIGFSISVFAVNIIFSTAPRLAVLILKFWISTDSLGNFIYAYKVVEYIGEIAAFIYFPMITLAASKKTIKMEKTLLSLIRVSNTFVFLISLIILSCGKFMFPYIFGPSFSSMYSIFVCLTPGLFAICTSTFFTAYFFGKGFLRLNFISACILLFVLFALLYPFITVWGVNGAAIAFSIANIASLLFDAYAFRRHYRFSIQDVFVITKQDGQRWGAFLKTRMLLNRK